MTFATEATTTVGLKVVFEHEIRRVSFTSNTFSALHDLVATLFSLDKETITIKYKDDDEDLITMSLDNEVQDAIKLALENKTKTLHLFVTVKPKQSTIVPTEVPTASTCAERKQAWKAKNEAFFKEMQETREALFAAKEAGNLQLVKECQAKLKEMRERRIKAREERRARFAVETQTHKGKENEDTTQKERREECAKKHQMHMALHQERIATREAMIAAKQVGDWQTVKELRTKLFELRARCMDNRVTCQTNSNVNPPVLVAASGHVIARMPGQVLAPAHANSWQAMKMQRLALWTNFRKETQELRQALCDAKACGDWQAVKEYRAKLHEFRESHKGKLLAHRCHPTIVPAQATTPAPAQVEEPQKGRCHVVKLQRQAMWEIFRKEKQGLLEKLLAAKKSGDAQALAEAQAKMKAFRERVAQHKIPHAMFACSPAAPAQSTAPAQTTVPESTIPVTAQDAQAQQQRRTECEALRNEKHALRENLFAAKANGDIEAIKEARAKLHEMRERRFALRIARMQASVAPATPAPATPAPATPAPAAPAPAIPATPATATPAHPTPTHWMARRMGHRHAILREQL